MSSEAKSSKSRQFQPPKGTRDFYPQDMAVRRYIESVWRTTSINHGFDEVEGPTFESLDLYTHKSGPGIASELFQVFSGKDEAERAEIQKTGQAPFALRPEFTPTLARMVAAKADSLPKPIKWFAIPSHFRAERPQRGRLREFMQWNVDFIGDESPISDAEVLGCCIDALQRFGLRPDDVQVRISDRAIIVAMLEDLGIPVESIPHWLIWIDKRDRMSSETRFTNAQEFGATPEQMRLVEGVLAGQDPQVYQASKKLLLDQGHDSIVSKIEDRGSNLVREHLRPSQRRMSDLTELTSLHGFSEWCVFDPSIVRGLAYYTGTVFEIHESTGAERAIAGGGRYDNLIESFGGPKLPACGFGMGDVVLGNILHDKGLLPEEVYMEPLRPHAFVIAADDNAGARLPGLVASLRKEGFHIRHSYKTTRNVGKLLGDAAKSRARYAIILGKELAETPPRVAIKDLASGEQSEASLTRIAEQLRAPK